MTNNQLTDEKIKRRINEIEDRRSASRDFWGGDYEYPENIELMALRELQERRKADSEPVGYFGRFDPDDEDLIDQCSKNVKGAFPLYRHAQQPVVPDAYVRDERGRMMLNGVCEPKIGFGAGWNACRAAMLQAGYAVRDLSTPVDPQVAEYEQNVMHPGNYSVIGIDPASGPDRTVEVRYVAPPGYVMVPKEPAEAMINAWLSEVANWRGHVAGYKAMLATAPQEVKP